MAIQVSPGINISEYDATSTVPALSTTTGAIAGLFRWGPVGQLVLIDTENNLVKRFGRPTSNFNTETWFTAKNFLAYGNSLYISRAANTNDASANGCWNAIADTANGVANAVANGTYLGANVNLNFMLTNQVDYDTTLAAGGFAANASFLYAAKYPGAVGSSLTISTVDTPAKYSSNLVSVANVAFGPAGVNTTAIAGVGANGTWLANTSTFFNSNTSVINFNDTVSTINTATAASNLAAYTAWSNLTVGDWLTIGNSTIGTQTLQLSNKGPQPNLITVSASATVASGNNIITGWATSPVTQGILPGQLWAINTASFGASSSTPVLVSVVAVNSTAVVVNTNSTTSGATYGKIASNYLNLSFYSPYTKSVAPVPNGANVGRLWQYYNSVTAAPGTSYYGQNYGNSAAIDQIYAVVVDTLGRFTGVPGNVLEVFQNMSRATDSKTVDGASNYYVNVLNQQSQYVWWTNHTAASANYANTSANMTTLTGTTPTTIAFAGGQDGFSESNVGTNIGAITNAYDIFKSTETASISLLMAGKSDDTNTTLLGNYLIQNIAQARQDCVAFISPNAGSVVNNVGNELTSIQTFRAGLTASSYGVLDSGYKYQYDKYNDVYRYVPLNGDIAGLCVNVDTTKDPWWSPAGFNRGQIKNVVRLAYNPQKADRDILYPLGVNPVVTFPGQGTILDGDKTLSNPSAFDRINVRRLFIYVEKAIAQIAPLFEFNDSFTQAQFVSTVTPFLKDIQGRRGITDFKVICDATNNPPSVVDANQFVGDIYIKPARSINFVQLNFVAVRTGVSFSEVIGQF